MFGTNVSVEYFADSITGKCSQSNEDKWIMGMSKASC